MTFIEVSNEKVVFFMFGPNRYGDGGTGRGLAPHARATADWRRAYAAKIDTCKYYFIAWVNSPVSLPASYVLGPL